MLITSDVMIEGVHFLPDQPPESVGGKLLAVNISDIAAMGGRPGEAVVALMLPETTELEWVERFYFGIGKVASRFGVNIVGGDVSRHPDRITLAMTLTGRSRRDEVMYRSGGKSGDYLYVSGTLGDADAGLEILKSSLPSQNLKSQILNLKLKYLEPSPRVELGRLLARTHTASACIDLSDGIAVGSRQLAEASGLSIEIEGNSLPISDELKSFCGATNVDPINWSLKAGGDYELLFSVHPQFSRRVDRFGITRPDLPTLTRIGRLVNGTPGCVTVNYGSHKEELTIGGWEHFTITL